MDFFFEGFLKGITKIEKVIFNVTGQTGDEINTYLKKKIHMKVDTERERYDHAPQFSRALFIYAQTAHPLSSFQWRPLDTYQTNWTIWETRDSGRVTR